MSEPIRVILFAGRIPAHSVVRKMNGKKDYRLRTELKIYGPTGTEVISKGDDFRYIVDADGVIEIISASSPLVWVASSEDLLEYIQSDGKSEK
jgi:hypothetical protein